MELAPAFRADIVSADSRQVYRYMDIGTAKPTGLERAQVPHHMLDLAEPSDTYSAKRYRDEGLRVLGRIRAAGRVAFVTGGTGFYIRALLDGLGLPSVPPDPAFRERLREEAVATGSAALHRRLAQLDPASADRIHPNNLPRIIRALEIIEHVGGPVPAAEAREQVPALFLGLTLDRGKLHQRADRRVLAQIRAGLIEETRLLLEMGYSPHAPSLDGLAYRQMIAYLRSHMTLPEAISAYQIATHQYIRRQMTWFRADSRVIWLDEEQNPVAQARELVSRWLEGPFTPSLSPSSGDGSHDISPPSPL